MTSKTKVDSAQSAAAATNGVYVLNLKDNTSFVQKSVAFVNVIILLISVTGVAFSILNLQMGMSASEKLAHEEIQSFSGVCSNNLYKFSLTMSDELQAKDAFLQAAYDQGQGPMSPNATLAENAYTLVSSVPGISSILAVREGWEEDQFWIVLDQPDIVALFEGASKVVYGHAEETSYNDMTVEGNLATKQEVMVRFFWGVELLDQPDSWDGNFFEDAQYMTAFAPLDVIDTKEKIQTFLEASLKQEKDIFNVVTKCDAEGSDKEQCYMDGYCEKVFGEAYVYPCSRAEKATLARLPTVLAMGASHGIRPSGALGLTTSSVTADWTHDFSELYAGTTEFNHRFTLRTNLGSSSCVDRMLRMHPVTPAPMTDVIIDLGLRSISSRQVWIRDLDGRTTAEAAYGRQCVSNVSATRVSAYSSYSSLIITIQVLTLVGLAALAVYWTTGNPLLFSYEYLLSRSSTTAILHMQSLVVLYTNTLEHAYGLDLGNDSLDRYVVVLSASFMTGLFCVKTAYVRQILFGARLSSFIAATICHLILREARLGSAITGIKAFEIMVAGVNGGLPSICTGNTYCTVSHRAGYFLSNEFVAIGGAMICCWIFKCLFQNNKQARRLSGQLSGFEKECLGLTVDQYFEQSVSCVLVEAKIRDGVYVSHYVILSAGYIINHKLVIRQRDLLGLILAKWIPMSILRVMNMSLSYWVVQDNCHILGGRHTVLTVIHQLLKEEKTPYIEPVVYTQRVSSRAKVTHVSMLLG